MDGGGIETEVVEQVIIILSCLGLILFNCEVHIFLAPHLCHVCYYSWWSWQLLWVPHLWWDKCRKHIPQTEELRMLAK